VKKAQELHDEFVDDLKKTLGESGFSTQCVLQPIPALFGEIGAAKGGNMLGLDSVDTNSILWLGTVAYQDPAHDKKAHQKLKDYYKKLEKFARRQKGDVDWRYINYSDKTQDPLKSYGKDNLAFMKKVAAKYDPKSVFQKQVPGSFKVSKA
jgi:FAD/FMN-containing dehydrogenase